MSIAEPRSRAALLLVVAAAVLGGCGGGGSLDGDRPGAETDVTTTTATPATTTQAQPDREPAPRVPNSEGGGATPEEGGATMIEDGKLPKEFPADLELPAGSKIQTGATLPVEGGAQVAIAAIAQGTVDEVVARFEREFADWKRLRLTTTGTGKARMTQAAWSRDGKTASIIVSRSGDDTVFTINVAPS